MVKRDQTNSICRKTLHYSEALDMMGITLAEDCKQEASNRPWQNPIATVGVPRLPPGDLLHNKFGIVDQETVITGSHNWTDAANTGNDETVLVVHSSIVAAHYQREFERLYTNAILGIPPAIQKKVNAQRQQCRSLQPASGAASAIVPKGKHGKPREDLQSGSAVTAVAPRKATKRQPNQRVNLNTATQAELDALPGVSTKLAKRIIAARQEHPFTSLNDLAQLPGVSAKRLKRLETQVTW